MFCKTPAQLSLFQNTHNWLDRDYADHIRSLDNQDLVNDWFTVADETITKTEEWRACARWFAPDFWHVNSKAHKRLADIVKPYLDK